MTFKKWLLTPVLFFIAFSLSAQNAAELDAMLEAGAISAAAAARFVLGAADLLPQELSGQEAEQAAYDMALSKGWVNTAANSSITLKDTALLVMRAFDFKGGVLYRIFHNSRYAYREMIYRRLIQGKADPNMSVSGPRLLQIISKSLSYAGKDDILDAQPQEQE